MAAAVIDQLQLIKRLLHCLEHEGIGMSSAALIATFDQRLLHCVAKLDHLKSVENHQPSRSIVDFVLLLVAKMIPPLLQAVLVVRRILP